MTQNSPRVVATALACLVAPAITTNLSADEFPDSPVCIVQGLLEMDVRGDHRPLLPTDLRNGEKDVLSYTSSRLRKVCLENHELVAEAREMFMRLYEVHGSTWQEEQLALR